MGTFTSLKSIRERTRNKILKTRQSTLGDKVVYKMTKNLVEKYHEVYVDNFFTSVPLMEYLLSHKILCCGTLHTNKKYLPKNLSRDSDLNHGKCDYRVSEDDIVVYK